MTGRPPVLFPLFAALESLPGIGAKTKAALERAGIGYPGDLLFTVPTGVVDRRRRASVREVTPGAVATVVVRILSHAPPRTKGRPYRVVVQDEGTSFSLVWFRARGDVLERLLPVGEERLVSGKIELFDGALQMVHPDHVLAARDVLPDVEPVYPGLGGLTGRTVEKAVAGAMARAPDLADWVDPALRRERGWPSWRDALAAAHAPSGEGDVLAAAPARERLAYDEFFAHQATLLLARGRTQRETGQRTIGDGHLASKVLQTLDFAMTGAQQRSLDEITGDMASPARMNRLLQGDVGSGKTLVAFLALVVAIEAGGQGVLMAPTEILARQHVESLSPLAEAAGVEITLLTGRDAGEGRAAKRAAIAEGRASLVVGTHAVFQKGVDFADLRLAVIDEQHRFGVAQRQALAQKGVTDMLIMTATPIPRSLALAQYGDMAFSVIDEKPPGRQPIRTVTVSDARIGEVVDRLRHTIAEGQQAYWVCPLVEESERVDLAAAEERFDALRAALGAGHVGLVHGRLAPAEKDAAMADFVAGRTAVLVATTVVEVGVNVPSATIMVVERAESFGLAQLHQLRGRVGRGTGASSCLLLYHAPLSETAARRLALLRETEDGFRIAEEDLAIRGAGDVIGTAQSGLPRFRIADLERQAGLMAIARRDAQALVAADPDLSSDRGQALRVALWLHRQDEALRLLAVG